MMTCFSTSAVLGKAFTTKNNVGDSGVYEKYSVRDTSNRTRETSLPEGVRVLSVQDKGFERYQGSKSPTV